MTEITKITKDGGNTVTPSSRFTKVVFTLNNWTELEFTKILEDFDRLTKSKYIIGSEIGEQGTPHLQGYIEFGRQLSFKQIKKILPRAHFERARANRRDNINYCSKEKVLVSTFPIERKYRILKKEYENTIWKDWQQSILNLIDKPINPRHIHWYYDTKGNKGKSYLCKFLVLKYEGIVASGKTADIFNQVKSWLESNPDKDPELILIDIPRTAENYINYGALEALKNGCFYSGKYEGGICIFPIPRVICFANFQPPEGVMSEDRWKITYLE